MKRRLLLFSIILFLLSAIPGWAQSDDIEVTDSTSTEWGGGTGGGVNPQEPNDPVTSLDISRSAITMEGGETVRLVATVNQRARNKKIVWTTDNEDVASVDANGLVIGMLRGSATIVAMADGNTSLKETCKVTVTSDYAPLASGYILPWGGEMPWTMKYQSTEYCLEPGDISWTMPDYDDSNWPILTGPMGNIGVYNFWWGDDWNGYNLRCNFDLPSVDKNAVYTFYANHDDDLWIYLNGRLVSYFDGWSDGEAREVEVPAEMLVKGKNVLALRIMEGSGDQYLDYAFYVDSPWKNVNITMRDGWSWVSHSLKRNVDATTLAGDEGQRVLSQTEELFNDDVLGWIGSLQKMKAGECYKVKRSASRNVTLSGKELSTDPVQMKKGWNWVGYNSGYSASLAHALSTHQADEGDVLFSSSGFAFYSGGQWMQAQLDSLHPGEGYMYKSAQAKQLVYNTEKEAQARRTEVRKDLPQAADRRPSSAAWTPVTGKYSSQMALIAALYENGSPIPFQPVAAFCDDECRGVSVNVNGMVFLSINGETGDVITLRTLADDGSERSIEESLTFDADIHGSPTTPVVLHVGGTIDAIEYPVFCSSAPNQEGHLQGNNDQHHTAYDLCGRRLYSPQRGFNIIKSPQGTPWRKVIVPNYSLYTSQKVAPKGH